MQFYLQSHYFRHNNSRVVPAKEEANGASYPVSQRLFV
jgi:hypothetical protein